VGALSALLLARLTAVLKRTAFVYAIVAAGSLLGVFAAGYAFEALRAAIALRHGALAGSLIVAGILAALALLAIAAALLMRRRAVAPSAKASPYGTPPTRRPYSREGVTALASAAAGAVCTGVVIYASPKLRSWLSGKPRS
jgi:hypothetical protein